MNNRYTDCPGCGHHRSVHNNGKSFTCDYAFARDSLGAPRAGALCHCKTTQKQIDAHIASFDERTCKTCGLGEVDQQSGSGWSHQNANSCIRVMGKKLIAMERELFSRRAAIRDQKERNNG
jgi:hypothetical protein